MSDTPEYVVLAAKIEISGWQNREERMRAMTVIQFNCQGMVQDVHCDETVLTLSMVFGNRNATPHLVYRDRFVADLRFLLVNQGLEHLTVEGQWVEMDPKVRAALQLA